MGASKKPRPPKKARTLPRHKTVTLASAPAVHSDALWDNPGTLHNITPEPIDSRRMTKREYFALLNKHGWRMKNQQESTTGPAQEPAPVVVPFSKVPTTAPEPLTADEGRLFGAMEAFYRQYGIQEALYCASCFTRKRHHGCRVNVTDRDVSVACRCGTATYRPPVGTTDLVIRRFTTTAITENDKTTSLVQMPFGNVLRPTAILEPVVARLLAEYFKMLTRRNYEAHWYHRGCWTSGRLDPAEQVAMNIGPLEIAIVCACRVLYYQAKAH